MLRNTSLLFLALMVAASPVAAQLGVPALPLPRPAGPVGAVTETLENVTENARGTARDLLRKRDRDISRLVRRNRDIIELDARGAPARRGELLVMDADMPALANAQAKGFTLSGRENIAELDMSVVRLKVPRGMSLQDAQEQLNAIMPGATVSADNLHFTSGAGSSAIPALESAAMTAAFSAPVGVIDGGARTSLTVTSTRGFAKGAPRASDHGSAVVSLLKYAGARNVFVADVYGNDLAGGNAMAIARALGWLTAKGCKVVTISLVGPENAVVSRAITASQKHNIVVVAAVGNDGPAAPPAYPASYKGVVSVTGVDRHGRALIEAGRALHLDYAAPGADIHGMNAKGKIVRLRGTSFAAPLVAARTAAAITAGGNWRKALDSEAMDLGPKGHDDIFGRGLVCANCRGPE